MSSVMNVVIVVMVGLHVLAERITQNDASSSSLIVSISTEILCKILLLLYVRRNNFIIYLLINCIFIIRYYEYPRVHTHELLPIPFMFNAYVLAARIKTQEKKNEGKRNIMLYVKKEKKGGWFTYTVASRRTARSSPVFKVIPPSV